MTLEELDNWIKDQQERALQPYVTVMSQDQYDLILKAEDIRGNYKVDISAKDSVALCQCEHCKGSREDAERFFSSTGSGECIA